VIERAFKQHPESIGETYVEHAKHANRIGWLMIAGGCACLVHAVFPFLCERTGSRMIKKLADATAKRVPAHEQA